MPRNWASSDRNRSQATPGVRRVHRVEIRDENGSSLLTLPDDVPRLEKEIDRLRQTGRIVAMVVIDPIGAFLGEATDTHRDASVRRALAPLAAMCERLDLVVVVVAHLTKDHSARLINRVSGAGAFVNAARSVLVLARDPGDPRGEQGSDRVLLHVATNWGRYADTLAWRVESRQVTLDDDSSSEVGYLSYKGTSSVDVEDVQRGADENGTDAEEAIAAALATGARPSRDVKAEVCESLGCSKRTVERASTRMMDRGELAKEQGGFPRTTTWSLIGTDTGRKSVATRGDGLGVATERSDIATAVSKPSGDSGGTSTSDVASVAEHELVDALRDAFDAEELAALPEHAVALEFWERHGAG